MRDSDDVETPRYLTDQWAALVQRLDQEIAATDVAVDDAIRRLATATDADAPTAAAVLAERKATRTTLDNLRTDVLADRL